MTENEKQDEKQGEIKTSDEVMAEVLEKDDRLNQTANDNLGTAEDSPLSQQAADNPDAPLSPSYTGTMDTSGT